MKHTKHSKERLDMSSVQMIKMNSSPAALDGMVDHYMQSIEVYKKRMFERAERSDIKAVKAIKRKIRRMALKAAGLCEFESEPDEIFATVEDAEEVADRLLNEASMCMFWEIENYRDAIREYPYNEEVA